MTYRRYSVFDLCRRIKKRRRLTEDEIFALSELINKQTDEIDDSSDQWPTKLLIRPLQAVWNDGVIDSRELKVLAELLVSIVYNSELEENKNEKNLDTAKLCPYCGKVLMSSIIPRCSWCGEQLKRNQMYTAKKDWLGSKKIEDAWDDVLNKKQMSCFENWFGRLYECPIEKFNESMRRYSNDNYDDW